MGPIGSRVVDWYREDHLSYFESGRWLGWAPEVDLERRDHLIGGPGVSDGYDEWERIDRGISDEEWNQGGTIR